MEVGIDCLLAVSTHSRPKAAGIVGPALAHVRGVSTHSRPKAAGKQDGFPVLFLCVSTHSRPKAAGPCWSL